MTLSSMQKNGLLLAAFAVIATALVVGTDLLTEDRINEQQQRELLANLNQVIAPESHDNDLLQSCRVIDDPSLSSREPHMYVATQAGELTGVAFEATAPNGYSGAIELLIGLDANDEITGVRVLQHKETPGLGDKIELRRDDWILSFNGQKVEGADDPRFDVRRYGGSFDQFTGATITPRAVVQAVARGVAAYQTNKDLWLAQQQECF